VPPAGDCLHQHLKCLLRGNTYLLPRHSRTKHSSLLEISHLDPLSARYRGQSPGLPKLDPRSRLWLKEAAASRDTNKQNVTIKRHSMVTRANDEWRVVEAKTSRVPWFICLRDSRQTHRSPAAFRLGKYVSRPHRSGDGTSQTRSYIKVLHLSLQTNGTQRACRTDIKSVEQVGRILPSCIVDPGHRSRRISCSSPGFSRSIHCTFCKLDGFTNNYYH